MVLIFIIATILYRILITIPLYRGTAGLFKSHASTIASVTASLLNLLIILILGRFYEKLALKLTQWGTHQLDYTVIDELAGQGHLLNVVM